jgi:hypothetical protein
MQFDSIFSWPTTSHPGREEKKKGKITYKTKRSCLYSFITLMDCSSGDLASKDLIYKILTRETSMVSITLCGSILRIKEKTASLISASISCSLEAPALITAARTCKKDYVCTLNLKE